MKKFLGILVLGLGLVSSINAKDYNSDLKKALDSHKKTKSSMVILEDTSRSLKGVISEKDPNTFREINFLEEKKKKVRLTPFEKNKKWGLYNIYSYVAEYENGQTIEIWIDSRFNSEIAKEKALEWAKLIGYLPRFLRKGLAKFYIDKRNGNNFADDRFNLITMYDGHREGKEFLKNNLFHEADHATKYPKKGWSKARKKDGKLNISHYAKTNAIEDRAETVLAWMTVKYRSNRISDYLYNKIINGIPHRLEYFDKQDFEIYPWDQKVEGLTPINLDTQNYVKPKGSCKPRAFENWFGECNAAGLLHGKGTLELVYEGITYQGEFVNGKMHGYGSVTFLDGRFQYEGKWKDGKKNGQGTGIWANGNRFVGEWKDDEPVN